MHSMQPHSYSTWPLLAAPGICIRLIKSKLFTAAAMCSKFIRGYAHTNLFGAFVLALNSDTHKNSSPMEG